MNNEILINHIPVFVYGTLRKGFGNYSTFLEGETIKELPATLHGGKIYPVSYGGFPCLVESKDKKDKVVGELMFLDKKKYFSIMFNLDDLEGYDPYNERSSMYLRKLAEVETEEGTYLAWVYVWNGEVSGKPIKNGDWADYMANIQKHSPAYKTGDLQLYWEEHYSNGEIQSLEIPVENLLTAIRVYKNLKDKAEDRIKEKKTVEYFGGLEEYIPGIGWACWIDKEGKDFYYYLEKELGTIRKEEKCNELKNS